MKIIIASLLSLLCITTWLLEPSASQWLNYNRTAVDSGQWWRFFSANLVHLGLWHTLLNITSLWFIALIFKSLVRDRDWIIWLILLFVANIIGLHLFVERLDFYVGMSGALYGLIAAACVCETRLGEKLSAVLLGLVALKIFAPHILGISSEYDEWLGGSVVEESHLIGFIQGLLVGLLWPKSRLQAPSFSTIITQDTQKKSS